MRKLIFTLFCGTTFLLASYPIGATLDETQAIKFYKDYNSRPAIPWPNIKVGIKDIPKGKDGELIAYGASLLANTETLIGPKSKLKITSAEVNCAACHQSDNNGLAGTKQFVLPYINAVNNFPKLDLETMKIVSLEDRVRAMAGTTKERLSDDSREMKAIIAYFHWLKSAYKIKDGVKLEGTFLAPMEFPNKMANVINGQKLYQSKCAICHGPNGKGQLLANYTKAGGHSIPSLLIWPDGGHMSMIPILARFLRSAMPLGSSYSAPTLSPSEALDIAAYVNTGFLRLPMLPTENRAGLDYAYNKSGRLKPEYFASPMQQLDPFSYIKTKYGPWKQPNYFAGE